jgi:DivIVA domain-containing protein
MRSCYTIVRDLKTMTQSDELLKELHTIRFRRVFRGYAIAEVDDTLHRVEAALQEQANRIQEMEKALVRYREQEDLLKTTLLRAEKNMTLACTQAESEARVIKSSAAEQAAQIIEEATRQLENSENELSNYRRLYESRLGNYEQEAKMLLNHFTTLFRRHLEAVSQEISVEVRELVRRLGSDLEILPRPALSASALTAPSAGSIGAYPILEITLTQALEPARRPAAVMSTPPAAEPEATVKTVPDGVPPSAPASALVPPVAPPEPEPAPPSPSTISPPEGSSLPSAVIPQPPAPTPTVLLANPPRRSWEEEEMELLTGQLLSRDVFDHQGRLLRPKGTALTPPIVQDLIAKGLYGEMITALVSPS